jgi:hypothetical protein
MAAFPQAKVLLNVRDPEAWFESVRDSIYVNNVLSNSLPFSIISRFFGKNHIMKLIKASSYTPMVNQMALFPQFISHIHRKELIQCIAHATCTSC